MAEGEGAPARRVKGGESRIEDGSGGSEDDRAADEGGKVSSGLQSCLCQGWESMQAGAEAAGETEGEEPSTGHVEGCVTRVRASREGPAPTGVNARGGGIDEG